MTLQQPTASGARMGVWYVRGISGFLLLQGLAGAPLKIAGGNQAVLTGPVDDLEPFSDLFDESMNFVSSS